jgi:pimeloyl-ACP methyl ester carboxylesterase
MLAALAPAPPAPAHAGLAPARPATAHAGASAGVQAATQAQSRPAMVADPAFEPLPGAQVYVGALTGAGYRIEVPFDWNGELVLWAHGYRGENPQLEVSDPPIREWFVRNGYAWAASSYRRNGYAVEEGIEDTEALRAQFPAVTGRASPSRTYVMGESMGGHVLGAALERYPQGYDGALALCGALGDIELFDYYLDHALVAQTLAGVASPVPPPQHYLLTTAPPIAHRLGYGPGRTLTAEGRQLAAAIQNLSGGQRPLFGEAFAYWSGPGTDIAGLPFLLGLYGGALTGGRQDPALYAAVGNADTVYTLDADRGLSPEEQALNDSVPRLTPDPSAQPPFPVLTGEIAVPVLTLHTLGDLFVPLSMQQAYARRVAGGRTADLLVSRVVRDVGHCGFTVAEIETAFADLAGWVGGGVRPAGDPILDSAAVAQPDFGCRFTNPARQGLPACPP